MTRTEADGSTTVVASHYDGRAPHTLENCGPTAARVLIAATPANLEPSVSVLVAAHANGNGHRNGNGVQVDTRV